MSGALSVFNVQPVADAFFAAYRDKWRAKDLPPLKRFPNQAIVLEYRLPHLLRAQGREVLVVAPHDHPFLNNAVTVDVGRADSPNPPPYWKFSSATRPAGIVQGTVFMGVSGAEVERMIRRRDNKRFVGGFTYGIDSSGRPMVNTRGGLHDYLAHNRLPPDVAMSTLFAPAIITHYALASGDMTRRSLENAAAFVDARPEMEARL